MSLKHCSNMLGTPNRRACTQVSIFMHSSPQKFKHTQIFLHIHHQCIEANIISLTLVAHLTGTRTKITNDQQLESAYMLYMNFTMVLDWMIDWLFISSNFLNVQSLIFKKLLIFFIYFVHYSIISLYAHHLALQMYNRFFLFDSISQVLKLWHCCLC